MAKAMGKSTGEAGKARKSRSWPGTGPPQESDIEGQEGPGSGYPGATSEEMEDVLHKAGAARAMRGRSEANAVVMG